MKKITLFFALLLFTAFNYTVLAAQSQTAVCTAGNLATVAANYLTTVTNLTVTGTIDARDFKTMRDDMPLLEVIDLSGSAIVEYIGTAGTNGAVSQTYLANSVPDHAFTNPITFLVKWKLKSFIFPPLTTTIGERAFTECSALAGSLNLPESITTIKKYAFLFCEGLTGTLKIPSKTTSIGYGAFANCTGLTGDVNIPALVTLVDSGAFFHCATSYTVDTNNPNYSSLNGVLFNKNKTTLIQYPTSKTDAYLIPPSVTSIGIGAFGFCSWQNNTIVIPNSVTIIGERAFSSCSSLTSIYAYSTSPIDLTLFADVFYGIDKINCTLYVPVGTVNAYKAANQWSDFTNIVEGFPTSLNEVSSSNISICPNPATSYITVSGLGNLEGNTIVTLSIVDVSGTPLLVKEAEPTINTLSIDVSTLKKGTYFITGQTSNGNIVKRFIKE